MNSYFYMLPLFSNIGQTLGKITCGARFAHPILTHTVVVDGYGKTLLFQSFKKHEVDTHLIWLKTQNDGFKVIPQASGIY